MLCGMQRKNAFAQPADSEIDLLVHWLGGLCIADASAMPQITTGYPNAPVTMIAEQAADLIAERP